MKNILNRFLFCVYYFFFWILFFVFTKVFFLVYYLQNTKEIGFLNSLKTIYFGFRLDVSITAYLSIFPFLLIIFSVFTNAKPILKTIKFYTFLLLAIINLLMVIDAGLYSAWGIRLDATLLNYLNTPEIMLASVSNMQLFLGILFWIASTIIFILVYNKFIKTKSEKISKGKIIEVPVFLVLFLSLIIPIRGGLQTIPVNLSNVYFSDKMFANHAAINFGWNFFNALTKISDNKNPYVFFDDKTAEKIISKNRLPLLISNQDSILNTNKPNVILIIWESLPAKFVGSLNGEKEVTVNLNQLSNEGILFTNFYGNADRTDKGIPAILSGYYPQPRKSIMKLPNKTRSLPFLSKEMIHLGYKNSFYYGGDLNFGNLNTYLRTGNVFDFVDGDEFSKKDWNSKWGAHDHVLFNRLKKDLSKSPKKPFFKTVLTLTSHEPFEFPRTYKFGKETELNKFRSSHAYTDEVIGDFVAFAKKQTWWKNTLIVIMADHGHGKPKHKGNFNGPKKFQIPMLWLGGALQKTNIKISNPASQVDFSYTLLDLLDGNNKGFQFGKNIFSESKKHYAYYNFNNGFGIVTKNSYFIYDFTGNKVMESKGLNLKKLDSLGKAITQNAFQDFLDRN